MAANDSAFVGIIVGGCLENKRGHLRLSGFMGSVRLWLPRFI